MNNPQMALHQEQSFIYNCMGSGPQEYFGKPLSSTTIHSYTHKCQLKLYCTKRKPYVNPAQKHRKLLWALRHLGWTITQWKRVLWSDESVFQVFFGRNGRVCFGPKKKRTIQTVTSNKSKSQVWGCQCPTQR